MNRSSSRVRRGEVYWFVPTGAGSVQQGRRPALIVQNDRGNQSSPTTVVAIISTAIPARPYPFAVILNAEEGGLRRESYVNCSQLFTVNHSDLQGYIGELTEKRMEEIGDALRYQLDL